METYLFPWPQEPKSSQILPFRIGGCDDDLSGGIRGENLCGPLKMGAGREKKLHQVICYRPGPKTRALDLEEEKKVKIRN